MMSARHGLDTAAAQSDSLRCSRLIWDDWAVKSNMNVWNQSTS